MLIAYEKKCLKCGGSGVFDIEVQTTPTLVITPKTCVICGGRGTVLNEDGEELMSFIKKYL
jgi:DnaJ-class molecular chaperone